MRTPLYIWGASGHGQVAADAARCGGQYEVVGFIDDDPAKVGGVCAGVPVLAATQILPPSGGTGVLSGGTGVPPVMPSSAPLLFLAIGANAARLAKAQALSAAGWRFATIIHPRATVAADVTIGAGTLLAAGAVVNPAAVIGQHVIINTLAGVDHHCVLEDGVHIAPGAHLAGRVHVGRGTMVGLGAAVRDGISIGANSLIGAGAAVVENIPDGVVAVGVPARVVRPYDPQSPRMNVVDHG